MAALNDELSKIPLGWLQSSALPLRDLKQVTGALSALSNWDCTIPNDCDSSINADYKI